MCCSCIDKHTCTCIDIHTFVAKYCYNMFKSSFKILLNISEIVASFRCKTKGMLHVSNFFQQETSPVVVPTSTSMQWSSEGRTIRIRTSSFSPGLLARAASSVSVSASG